MNKSKVNEGFFDSIGRSVGSTIGKVKNAINNEIQIPNQDDLAEQILQHLNSLSTSYNRSGNFDPNGVSSPSRDIYTFIMSFSGDSNQGYKVDVIKHIDFRTTKQPEYTIILNKVISSNPDLDRHDSEITHDSVYEPRRNRDIVALGSDPNQEVESKIGSPSPHISNKKDTSKLEAIDNIGKEAEQELESKKTKDSFKKTYQKYIKILLQDFYDDDEEVKKRVNNIIQNLNKIKKSKDSTLESIFLKYEDFLNEEVNLGGHGTVDKPNLGRRNSPTVDHGKGEVLKCDINLARQIFNKAEEVYRLTRKTTSGDARGGSNQP